MIKVNTKISKRDGPTIQEFARMAARAAEKGEGIDGGNVTGTVAYTGSGLLSGEEARLYQSRDRQVRYTFLSYRTPIAYLWDDSGTLKWTLIKQKFSSSTTSHQSFAWRVVSESIHDEA